MRLLSLLLVLTGCRVEGPPADAGPPTPAAAPRAGTPASQAPEAPLADTLARGPGGAPLPADTLVALVAAADTSAARTVSVLGRAGVYHGAEVEARPGERWQGLYPAAAGVEVRSFRLDLEAARDEVLDDDGGPYTGVRVATPFSSPADGFGIPEDAALALVRRPGAPFPAGPVLTAFAGEWPVRSGRLALALGDAWYELHVVEGPETVWTPHRGAYRPDRVLVLIQGERRQAVSAIVGGEDGRPALLWAGDLDGDGRLDLLIDETNHFNLSAPALHLSSSAGAGTLVRRVGRHESVGC